MLKKIKFIIILLIIIFAIISISYRQGISGSADKKGQDKIFIIKKGESVDRIGGNLAEAGLIKSKLYFKIYVWRDKAENNLQAGKYVLNPKLNIKEITRILSSGKVLNDELTIKIIEGWTLDDINKYFINNNIIADDSFIDLAKTKIGNWKLKSKKPDFLDDVPADANLEGFLFPDTYKIFKGASAEDIIGKMLDNFGSKLTDKMRADAKKQGKTIYDIVRMASIVEKEVRTPRDMKIASGLFWDRMKNGQALESDATLSYFFGTNKPRHSLEELKVDSSYNSYKYRGLPPTPISNPGLNAIKAAIYPEHTDYNYFLSKPGAGETVFSKTYNEHLKNKAKYLK